MTTFIAEQHLELLEKHKLAGFEQLWRYEGTWFEPPNRERGGWSGVNFIELIDAKNNQSGFYLKRQQSFTRRTLCHPVAGEPTFVREFEVMQHLKQHDVATPVAVFFANKNAQAILLTEALEGYVSLEHWLISNSGLNDVLRTRNLIRELAREVNNLHQAHVQHRSLYPKHLFVKEENKTFTVALIDFEKSRITTFISYFRLADLITLNYRTHDLSRSQRLYFFKEYFKIDRLTPWHKFLCRYIYKKSLQKSRSKM